MQWGCWMTSPGLSSPQILSHGINSVFILLCLLELCTAIAALVFGHKAMKQQDYTRMVRLEPRHTPCRPTLEQLRANRAPHLRPDS